MLERLLDVASAHGVTVRWAPLPEFTGGGCCSWSSDATVVTVDPRLGTTEKASVLAHELGHALAGVPLVAGAPAALRRLVEARAERHADAAAADLTVDLDVVQAAADVVHDLGGHVTAVELADELGVPVRLAELAVERAFGAEVTRRRQAARAAGGDPWV